MKNELNEVIVKVDNSEQPNCRWYSGSGIYRHVWLETMPALLAFASADLKDTEPYTSARVTTWKGRALLVVRSTMKRGQAQVGIKSSLPTATVNIKMQ